MSLTINTNVEALDAQRNLANTENALSMSMERLSSGLKINSAADDVAGYAINQRLQSQPPRRATGTALGPTSCRPWCASSWPRTASAKPT